MAAVTAAGLSFFYYAVVAALVAAVMKAADAAADSASAAEIAAALSLLSSCFAAAAAATTVVAAQNANKCVTRFFKRLNNHKGIALTYTIKCMFLAKCCGRAYPDRSPLFLCKNQPSVSIGSPISMICPSGSKKRKTRCPHACRSMPWISVAPDALTRSSIPSGSSDSK